MREVVIVGGVAATIHGSARLTSDIDVVYDRSDDNLRLSPLQLADSQQLRLKRLYPGAH